MMSFKFFPLLFLIFCANSVCIAQVELSAREVARKSLPSVVLIICDNGTDIVQGSGFFFRPGVLVTNFHVVEGMSRGIVQVAIGVAQEKQTFRIARIIASDKDADLALLSIPAAKGARIPQLKLASEAYGIEVGETVYALGNPEGLVGTMSPGIVSAGLRSSQKKTRIQITAPISHGSSGGPVMNGVGDVIGVAVGSLSGGQNLNFAVPVSLVHTLANNAKFPDDRENALDTFAGSRATFPAPWVEPLQGGVGSGGETGIAPVADKAPKTAADYFYRGISNYDKGLFEEALSDFTKTIQLNPKSAEAYYERGLTNGKLLNYSQAIVDYTKAIALDPRDGMAYVNRGVAYVQYSQNYSQAITDFTKAIVLNPQDVKAYFNRGIAYVQNQSYRQAIADFTMAIQINPQDATAYNSRGNAYNKLGNHNLAIADYTRSIHINSQNADIFYNRGNLYGDIGNVDQAIADYTQAIQINPRHFAAYYNRGVIYAKRSNYRLAIADYTKAIEIDSQNADAYYIRGNLFASQDDNNLAVADYTKAIQLNPRHVMAFTFRAVLYCMSGQNSLAKADEKSVLEMGGQIIKKCE